MKNLNLSYRFALFAACLASSIAVDLRAAFATEVDGFTEPYREIAVAAPEMGIVVSMLVKEGDRVTAGQLVAQLEDQQVMASLMVAKAEMESRSRVEALKFDAELQSQVCERLMDLRSRNHATDFEVLRAQSQRDVSRKQYLAAEEERNVRKLEHDRLEVQLKRRKLYSPIDGIVTEILRQQGEFASPSEPIVLRVVQIDPLLIVFAVPSHLCRNMKVGQQTEISIEGQNAWGQIEFVSPKADPQSGTTRVRVRVPNPGEKLPCGASCLLHLEGVSAVKSLTAK
jgi:RND family efflux transporter MFP subunit